MFVCLYAILNLLDRVFLTYITLHHNHVTLGYVHGCTNGIHLSCRNGMRKLPKQQLMHLLLHTDKNNPYINTINDNTNDHAATMTASVLQTVHPNITRDQQASMMCHDY